MAAPRGLRRAEALLELFREPFEVGGQPLAVQASIGLALAPQHGQEVRTLQANADAAMYRVKRRGKNGVQLYESALPAGAR